MRHRHRHRPVVVRQSLFLWLCLYDLVLVLSYVHTYEYLMLYFPLYHVRVNTPHKNRTSRPIDIVYRRVEKKATKRTTGKLEKPMHSGTSGTQYTKEQNTSRRCVLIFTTSTKLTVTRSSSSCSSNSTLVSLQHMRRQHR